MTRRVARSWTQCGTAQALLGLAQTGVCPPDASLALMAGTFMDADGRITDVGRKTAKRIANVQMLARRDAYLLQREEET